MKPLKKLFRTVLIWLTARNAVRTTAETYFLARFMQHPALMIGVEEEHMSNEHARKLAGIFEQVIVKIDQRVVGQTATKIWRNLRKHMKGNNDETVDSEEVGRVIEEEVPGILADFDVRVSESLKQLLK